MATAFKLLSVDLDEINEVYSIQAYNRSGSDFFHSLLDNHPNVLTFPGSIICGYFDNFWPKSNNIDTIEKLIELFVNKYKVFFDISSNPERESFCLMSEDEQKKAQVDESKFVFAIKKLLNNIISNNQTISRKTFFKAIHVAYAYALDRKLNSESKLIIVFHLHQVMPERAEGLVQDFPNVIFLHMIRDPIQGTGSHLKSYYEKGVRSLEGIFWVLDCTFKTWIPIFEECRDNSVAIKLEDLHIDSKKILNKVCSLLNIEWSDTLLKSTFNGVNWKHPGHKNEKVIAGFNKIAISRSHDDFFYSI